MTEQESNQPKTEADAPEDGVEDIEINAEDAEAVTGGVSASLLWVGSRTDGRS